MFSKCCRNDPLDGMRLLIDKSRLHPDEVIYSLIKWVNVGTTSYYYIIAYSIFCSVTPTAKAGKEFPFDSNPLNLH